MYTVSMPTERIPNHGLYKKWQGYPCRLFFLCTFFGPKPTLTTSPQRLHFISSTVSPGGISSMSRMCRPHLGFGHLILSIDNRLPVLIWNKGTRQAYGSTSAWFPFIVCALLVFFRSAYIFSSYSFASNPTCTS